MCVCVCVRRRNHDPVCQVNDVALGIADVGCSLFWMTAERLEMTSFTANLLSDQFHLYVPKPKVDDRKLGLGLALDPYWIP